MKSYMDRILDEIAATHPNLKPRPEATQQPQLAKQQAKARRRFMNETFTQYAPNR